MKKTPLFLKFSVPCFLHGNQKAHFVLCFLWDEENLPVINQTLSKSSQFTLFRTVTIEFPEPLKNPIKKDAYRYVEDTKYSIQAVFFLTSKDLPQDPTVHVSRLTSFIHMFLARGRAENTFPP